MTFPIHKTVSHLRIQVLWEDSHVAGLVVPNDRTMHLPVLKESFNLNIKLLHYGETMGTTYKEHFRILEVNPLEHCSENLKVWSYFFIN